MSASTRTSNRDDSSALSTTMRRLYRDTLGSRCFVCGYAGKLEVAHVIPRRESSNRKVQTLKGWSIDLQGFAKDSLENFVLLCAVHHQQYDAHEITLLPSHEALMAMTRYEEEDWAHQLRLVNTASGDPGRRVLPLDSLPRGLLYIPVTIHYYVQVYNRTPFLNQTFPFDSWGVINRPNPRHRVPAYALLLMAFKPLMDMGRIIQPWSEAERGLALNLIKLYNRKMHPAPLLNRQAEEDGARVLSEFKEHTWTPPFPAPGTMPTIPESSHQEGGGEARDEAMDDFGESSCSETSDASSSGAVSEGGQEVGEYGADDGEEPVATLAVLKHRMRWQPIEGDDLDVGSMRFATSSDFITALATTGAQVD